jgi:hypothetical protein
VTRRAVRLAAGDAPDAPDARRRAWAARRVAWDVVPGSPSEAALATAVLLDADRYACAVVEAARIVIARRTPEGAREHPCLAAAKP